MKATAPLTENRRYHEACLLPSSTRIRPASLPTDLTDDKVALQIDTDPVKMCPHGTKPAF